MNKIPAKLIVDKISEILKHEQNDNLHQCLALTQLYTELKKLELLSYENKPSKKSNKFPEIYDDYGLLEISEAQDFMELYINSHHDAINKVLNIKNLNYIPCLIKTLHENKMESVKKYGQYAGHKTLINNVNDAIEDLRGLL